MRALHINSGLTALLLGMLLSASSARGAAPLNLTDCRLSDTFGVTSVAARCGTLQVPEDRARPQGRQIDLYVAVVPALSGGKNKAPLTVIAGGPGQASTEFYASYQSVFARLQRDHDIVMLDQRGTGRSNPLDCEPPDELDMSALSPEALRENTLACLEQLDGDPRFYTTSVAVEDLEAVRQALGYGQFDIYGVSYGSRVALHYLRRYPESVRTLILDGVAPADVALGPDIARIAQSALDRVFERCASSASCREHFPDLGRAYRRLLARLRESPVKVQINDPLTGAPKSVEFSELDLGAALRLLSYSADTVSLLPLLINEASNGNFGPMSAQALMVSRRLSEQLSYGMHNAVVCTEDVPYFDEAGVDREALAQTYIGTLQVDTLTNVCSVWPEGVRDDDFKSPVASDKPVLLLSGSADPVTPPSYGERAKMTLSGALHIVVEGQGHGQAPLGCMPRLIEDFVEAGTPDGLDVSCLEPLEPPPFFIDFAGPAP